MIRECKSLLHEIKTQTAEVLPSTPLIIHTNPINRRQRRKAPNSISTFSAGSLPSISPSVSPSIPSSITLSPNSSLQPPDATEYYAVWKAKGYGSGLESESESDCYKQKQNGKDEKESSFARTRQFLSCTWKDCSEVESMDGEFFKQCEICFTPYCSPQCREKDDSEHGGHNKYCSRKKISL